MRERRRREREVGNRAKQSKKDMQKGILDEEEGDYNAADADDYDDDDKGDYNKNGDDDENEDVNIDDNNEDDDTHDDNDDVDEEENGGIACVYSEFQVVSNTNFSI